MEPVGGGNLQGLWAKIDQQYLLYLIAEGRRNRKVEREKLNLFIKEYLYFAPHERKYIFPETAQIIRKSALTNPDFNPIKASLAWDAIGNYAINLVLQPWRKEFHELRLYCGYFKHHIDECLVDAELMFELMGFCRIGNATMTISGILDPDKITNVSRDSFMASMECQILREIWENVTPYYDFVWYELLEYRERHTGSAEQAVKTLKFHRRQLLYEKEAYLRAQQEIMGKQVPMDFIYGSNSGYFNRIYYNRMYSSPAHSRLIPVNLALVSSPAKAQARVLSAGQAQEQAQALPPGEPQEQVQVFSPREAQQALNFQDTHPRNDRGQAMQERLSDIFVDHPNNRSFDSDQSSIPTGQLIELDSTQFQVHEPPKEYLENDGDGEAAAAAAVAPPPPASASVAVAGASRGERQEKAETSFFTPKSKRNILNPWEDWTYICTHLNKVIVDTDSSSEGENRNESPDPEGKDKPVIFKKMKMRSNKLGKKKQAGTGKGGEKKRAREESPVIKRDEPVPGPSGLNRRKRNDSEIEIYVESPKPKPKPKSRFADEDEYDDDDDEDNEDSTAAKWQCITCTFLNTKERSICQMCFKSKEPGNETRPRPKKGIVCKKCTLINEEDNNFCDACGKRLTYAAIFI